MSKMAKKKVTNVESPRDRKNRLARERRAAKKGTVANAKPVSSPSSIVKKKVTRVGFVLDRSGSMQAILPAAIRSLNENVDVIKKSATETGQSATISLMVFDSETEVKFLNRSTDNYVNVAENSIRSQGMTALLDATGEMINLLRAEPVSDDEDVAYLLFVITDGQENQSRKYTATSLKTLMKEVQGTDRWTLTFLVPVGDAKALINNFGIPEGNVAEWETSRHGVETYTAQNNAGLRNYMSSRAVGTNSVKTFYTDLSKVTLKDVSQLKDVSNLTTLLTVPQDANIREFIESQGKTFIKGAAFYQLVPGKREADKVQNYKEVLIFDKRSNKVFGGDDARQVLGLPLNEMKIRPGNHGNFDIFVQSTSVNRKVKAGTKVIFMPSAV